MRHSTLDPEPAMSYCLFCETFTHLSWEILNLSMGSKHGNRALWKTYLTFVFKQCPERRALAFHSLCPIQPSVAAHQTGKVTTGVPHSLLSRALGSLPRFPWWTPCTISTLQMYKHPCRFFWNSQYCPFFTVFPSLSGSLCCPGQSKHRVRFLLFFCGSKQTTAHVWKKM